MSAYTYTISPWSHTCAQQRPGEALPMKRSCLLFPTVLGENPANPNASKGRGGLLTAQQVFTASNSAVTPLPFSSYRPKSTGYHSMHRYCCLCTCWVRALDGGEAQQNLPPRREQWGCQCLSKLGGDSTTTAAACVQPGVGSLNVASVKAQRGWQMSLCSRNKQHSPVGVAKTVAAKPEWRGAVLWE